MVIKSTINRAFSFLLLLLLSQNVLTAVLPPYLSQHLGILWLRVDQPGAHVYVNAMDRGKVDDNGDLRITLPEGRHLLLITKPIENSVYSYQSNRKITVHYGLNLVNLSLHKTLDPGWWHHFQNLSKNNRVDNDVRNSLHMLNIPAGEFTMGSNEIMFARPPHKMQVAAFKISKYEVTFDLYDRFVSQTSYDNPADDGWGRGQRPVINVSWDDAQIFLQWLNSVTQPEKPYRLPTEVEWEYAARGGTTSYYWWGDKPAYRMANCSDCGDPWYRRTTPVGSFAPTPMVCMIRQEMPMNEYRIAG